MRAHARLMLMDQIEKTVLQIPGQTATEIARSLFGLDGYQERVNHLCAALVKAGRIERRGKGGPGDPFKHYPVRVE